MDPLGHEQGSSFFIVSDTREVNRPDLVFTRCQTGMRAPHHPDP